MIQPLRISWSQLRAHAECRQKAHLLRSGRRNKAANIRNYFHGSVVDRLMRDWLANPQRSGGQMVAAVPDMIAQAATDAISDGDGVVRWRDAGDRATVTAYCIELVRRLEPILTERVLPHRYDNGRRFTVPVVVPYLDGTPTTVQLTGEVDLVVFRDAGLDIWDLKGTADNSYWRKVLGQLVFYDLAMLASGHGHSDRVGFLQPMCSEAVLEFVLTADQRQQMWSAIVSMCEDIWRGDITCTTDPSRCTVCDVRHGCPRFATESLLAPALRGITVGSPA